MSAPPRAYRWHQFNLKQLIFVTFLFSLPFGIWEFRKTRTRQFSQAAMPFRHFGATATNLPSSTGGLLTYLFRRGNYGITSISFMNTPLTDEQLTTLRADFQSVPKLNHLLLENTKITDNGLLCVSELKNLTCLRLDGTAITDVGVERIRNLTKLRELGLAGTNVTDGCIENLQGMHQLRCLLLSDTQITDDGLAILSSFANLESLSLGNTAISDRGVAYLSSLSGLETLGLGNVPVTDTCLPDLKRLTNLRSIYIEGTHISDEGVRKLEAALPLCDIWTGASNPH